MVVRRRREGIPRLGRAEDRRRRSFSNFVARVARSQFDGVADSAPMSVHPAFGSNGTPFDTLFISANFFGYAREIAAEIERRGRKVMQFEDRPAVDTLSKALARIDPRLVAHSMECYFT